MTGRKELYNAAGTPRECLLGFPKGPRFPCDGVRSHRADVTSPPPNVMYAGFKTVSNRPSAHYYRVLKCSISEKKYVAPSVGHCHSIFTARVRTTSYRDAPKQEFSRSGVSADHTRATTDNPTFQQISKFPRTEPDCAHFGEFVTFPHGTWRPRNNAAQITVVTRTHVRLRHRKFHPPQALTALSAGAAPF